MGFRTTCAALAGVLGMACAGAFGQPANDDCRNAIDVAAGISHAYDLRGATNDWTGTCGGTAKAEDVWFRFTPPRSGRVTVSTCGLVAADTVISILAECGGPELMCRDDSCGLQTEAAFQVLAGEDYCIRVAEAGGGTHEGRFSIRYAPPCDLFPTGPTRPEAEPCGGDTNAGCAASPPAFEPIVCGDGISGTAWSDGSEGDTDWYELANDGPRTLTIWGQGVFPMHLAVHDASCPPNLLAEDFSGHCGVVMLTVPVSGACRIAVRNAATELYPCGFDAGSAYWFSVECTPHPAPENDDCRSAAAISGFGPHVFNTRLATTDGVGDPSCHFTEIHEDVWFDWTSDSPAGTDVVVSMCGMTFIEASIAVYVGGTCVGPILACSDGGCPGGDPEVRFSAGPPGSVYKIRVGAEFGPGGPGAFSVACRPACTGIDLPPVIKFDEDEPCGTSNNPGCFNGSLLFYPIWCNALVLGTTYFSPQGGDNDGYSMTVGETGTVSATVTSEVPVYIQLRGSTGCSDGPFVQDRVDPCQTRTLTLTGRPPGSTAVLYVRALQFPAYVCGGARGNDYLVQFDLGDPNPVPCERGCPCTFNNDPHLNSQDFFDFLTCFFSGDCPPAHDADYNEDNLVNSQDFFDFLTCFFAPPSFCP